MAVIETPETGETAAVVEVELTPENAKGMVTTNWPPNACAAGLANHAVASPARGIDTVPPVSLKPDAAVKMRSTLVRV